MAGTYGRLIVRGSALPASMIDTRFAHTTPARSFLLVVSQTGTSELQFKWSVHCFNPARRESGGASGEVAVTSGRWVKQVRANWIRHPTYCTGSIAGSAAGSPVLVRVFAQ